MCCLGLSSVKGSEQQQSKLQGTAFIPKEAVEDETFEIEKGNVSPVDLAFTPERRHRALTISMPLAALHPHPQHRCLPAMPGLGWRGRGPTAVSNVLLLPRRSKPS
ncbi:STARP-like antigen [Echinococcus multilocularis]|uniref:STARP-like antigen n=1 Tax=Echinococcus multilocularis TaxID=6211 RepID=A0A087VYF6_ECHMU|nr:hypothetical protein EmuJ_000114700 [Echinococcus multilocularis]CUT98731.1 STARP-like antigen [Echinococcus multilocularis]